MNKQIFQQEIRDWDNNAEFYLAESRSPFKRILREEMKRKFLIKGRNIRILDLGAGIGDLANDLLKDGYEVICVDFSPRMRELALRENPNLKYVLGSAHKLPFPNSYFDIVIAGGVLHHLKIQELLTEGMREAGRVLKPSGKFCYLDRSNAFTADVYEKILHIIKVLFTKLKGNYAASSTSSETSLTEIDLGEIRKGFKVISRKPSYAMPFKLLMVVSNTIYYTAGEKAYRNFQDLFLPFAYLFERYLNFPFWETEYCEVLKK